MSLPLRRSLGWLVLVVMTATARAQLATLVADAHVNSTRTTVNSGTISNLNVGNGYTALVQFDLGLLPAVTTAAQVTRAVLRVYCNRVNTAGTVSVEKVGAAWGEYSVTYATLSTLSSSVASATVSQAGEYVAIDVTATVQGWVATPSSNNGLALTGTAVDVQFDSKENDQTAHAPMLEIALAGTGAAGPAGPQGPIGSTGLTGLTGPQGPAGASGPAGPQGLTGVAGLQGVAGPAGVAGPQGPVGATGSVGATGPAGAAVANYRGNYAAATSYALDDAVSFAGSTYISLVAANAGNAPSGSPLQWAVLAAQGLTGATGAQGSAGAVGPAGAAGVAGAAGAVGAQGPPVLFRGAWSAVRSYAVGDAVSFGGASYIALLASLGQQPDTSAALWGLLAAQGEVGPAGALGPSGPAGAAATVRVGTVTTGAAGSQAVVTNSGTAAAAVLNFALPQGAAGTGGGGGGSVNGALPVSVFHSVSFSFPFYSLSGVASSATETATVLTWMPNGCTATTLAVFSQQNNPIAVRLRQGAPGAMTDTPLVCSAASGGTCTAVGSVAVTAGSFLDLEVTGADGTPSAVWTAVGCS